MEQNKPLELSNLNISRCLWGSDRGKLTGSVTFTNTDMSTTITLSEEKARAILNIIAEQLVENAKDFSKVMLQHVIQASTTKELDALNK